MAWPASPPPAPDPPAVASGDPRTPDPVPLEEARLDRGLTVAALAARAGVSEATIYRLARGATEPRPHVVRRLSAALGRGPGEIVEFRRGDPQRPGRRPGFRQDGGGSACHTG
jgi:DNA-binding Xre family transcriptional regulator